MLGRLLACVASLGAAAGCYRAPEPDCGFSCGPGAACPDGYTCAADHRCHRNGAPDSLTCDTAPDGSAAASPLVLSTDPANGAIGVAVDITPTAVVTQDLLGVTDQTFYMVQGAAPVPGHALYVPFSKQLQFVPDAQLDEEGLYSVAIAAGITSVAGEPLAPFVWTFHTGADTAPPRIHSTIPSPGVTHVEVTTNIEVTFDEPVTGVDTSAFTVAAASAIPGSISELDAKTYTFAPASNLPASSTITVTLGPPIQDSHGNMMTTSMFTFTTAPS